MLASRSLAVAGQCLCAADDGHEEIGLINGFNALQDREDSLETHAGVDPWRGQGDIHWPV